jgi:hypothetical protein
MQIRLTDAELRMAVTIGCERQMESLSSKRRDNHGKSSEGGWTEHIEGAAGELAVAKALGHYWNGSIGSFKMPDLGHHIQVRTRSQDHWDLIVRRDDNDDHLYFLAVGKAPTFRIVGFILGKDAKRAEWVSDYGGRPWAFFVPQSALTPIE